MRIVGLILISCALLLLSGCGGSSTAGSQAEGSAGLVVGAGGPPKVEIPPGPPPKKLIIRDLKTGTGAVLGRKGDISTYYVAYDYETGEVRENYWHSPFDIHFGPGWQTRGWEKGMPGMRVGGIRELIVPSRLAYKDGVILYVVKLVGVK